MPRTGPFVDVTLKPIFAMLIVTPPGNAIVWRLRARFVVARERVVARRRTVFVRERFTAGRAGLRRFTARGRGLPAPPRVAAFLRAFFAVVIRRPPGAEIRGGMRAQSI